MKPDVTIALEGTLLTVSGANLPRRSIDAGAISRNAGPGDLTGPVVVACLLVAIDCERWLGLSERVASEIVSEAVQIRWGDFSDAIVGAHRRALDGAREALRGTHVLSPSSFPAQRPAGTIFPGAPKLSSEYLGFRLQSPLVALVPVDAGEAQRSALASAPIGAVFFGPVAEEDLDREAWKTFAALQRRSRRSTTPGFKARPPLERYLDLLRAWKSSVEVPVFAGLSAGSEKNWLSMAFALEQAGADALELFLRAPEEGGPADPLRIVLLVAAALKIPVSVRPTPGLTHLLHRPEDLSRAGARGLTLESCEESRSASLDLAAAGPISASEDLINALLAGAKVMYVTPEPDNLTRLAELLKAWLSAKGFASLEEARAALNHGPENRS